MLLPLVAILLSHSGPPTVCRCVTTVVVDTIEAVARRGAAAHVGEERLEARFPLFAHLDSATAVVGESRVSRVRAAAFHGSPRLVLRRSPAACRVTVAKRMLVASVSFSRHLSRQATAGGGSSGEKSVLWNVPSRAAVADAPPSTLLPAFSGESPPLRRPPAKLLTGEVLSSGSSCHALTVNQKEESRLQE